MLSSWPVQNFSSKTERKLWTSCVVLVGTLDRMPNEILRFSGASDGLPRLRYGQRFRCVRSSGWSAVDCRLAFGTSLWLKVLFLSLSQRCDEGLQCSGMRRCVPRWCRRFEGMCRLHLEGLFMDLDPRTRRQCFLPKCRLPEDGNLFPINDKSVRHLCKFRNSDTNF